VKRTAVVVALAVLLSGCGAVGGPATDHDTVTPVPVPDDPPPQTATPTPYNCLAPPAAAPNRPPPATPSTPVALANDDGIVEGSTLVAQHGRTLLNYSYTLQIDDIARIQAMPDVAAFTYEGIALSFSSVQAYAVGGTLYTLDRIDGEYTVRREPYRPTADSSRRYRADLTGQSWLDARLSRWNYTVVDTVRRNGTELRVLKDTLERPVLSPNTGALWLNSTVLVDRRGIVREARHYRTIQRQSGTDRTNESVRGTLRVTDVGSTVIERPEAFCLSNPDATPVGPSVNGSSPTAGVSNATAERPADG
jgi:hypothetical protein